MLVLVDPWPRLLPGMSPLTPLAMGPPVGHMGSSTVRIRTLLNYHVRHILTRNERTSQDRSLTGTVQIVSRRRADDCGVGVVSAHGGARAPARVAAYDCNVQRYI